MTLTGEGPATRPVGYVMPSEQEGLDGQEQPRTRTARQETVAQASRVALHPKAASDPPATATVRPRGLRAGPRLQEGDEEAREEALSIKGVMQDTEALGAGERGLHRLVDQEEIGQKRPEVDRRVQVVDQL